MYTPLKNTKNKTNSTNTLTFDDEGGGVGGGAGGVGSLAGVVAAVVGEGVRQDEGAGELVEGAQGEALRRVLGEGGAVLEPGEGERRVASSHRADHLDPLPLACLPEAKWYYGGRDYVEVEKQVECTGAEAAGEGRENGDIKPRGISVRDKKTP